MLGCKIKAKEIKRLPLARKANSASLLLGLWWRGVVRKWGLELALSPFCPGLGHLHCVWP